MTKSILSSQLVHLGFSENEAIIYIILLEVGIQTAGFLIKKTGFHRNVVYTALDKLIGKQLVAKFCQGGVNKYRALSPENIVNEIAALKETALEVLPELLSLRKTNEADVMIYEGVEGFQSAHEQVLKEMKKNGIVYVMGARASFYLYMSDAYKLLDKIRLKNNIGLNVLGFSLAKKELSVDRPKMEIRFINESFMSPVGTSIYGENVLIQIYSEPTIVIRIKSKDVAKSYEEYFKLLWKQAHNV